MATRTEVYEAINGERDYQDALPADRTDGLPHTVGDYIVMLAHYQQRAVERWTLCAGDSEALHEIRKIAGIAVHCLEDHGVPKRPIR